MNHTKIKEKLFSKSFKEFLDDKLKDAGLDLYEGVLAGAALTAYSLEFIFKEDVKINDIDIFLPYGAVPQEGTKLSNILHGDESYYSEIYPFDHANYNIYDSFYIDKFNFTVLETFENFTYKELVTNFDMNLLLAYYNLNTKELYFHEDFIDFLKTKTIKFSSYLLEGWNFMLNFQGSLDQSPVASLIRCIKKKQEYNWHFDEEKYFKKLYIHWIFNNQSGTYLDSEFPCYSEEGDVNNLVALVSEKVTNEFKKQIELWRKYFKVFNDSSDEKDRIVIEQKNKHPFLIDMGITEIEKHFFKIYSENKFDINGTKNLSLDQKSLFKFLKEIFYFYEGDSEKFQSLIKDWLFYEDSFIYLKNYFCSTIKKDFGIDLLYEFKDLLKSFQPVKNNISNKEYVDSYGSSWQIFLNVIGMEGVLFNEEFDFKDMEEDDFYSFNLRLSSNELKNVFKALADENLVIHKNSYNDWCILNTLSHIIALRASVNYVKNNSELEKFLRKQEMPMEKIPLSLLKSCYSDLVTHGHTFSYQVDINYLRFLLIDYCLKEDFMINYEIGSYEYYKRIIEVAKEWNSIMSLNDDSRGFSKKQKFLMTCVEF